MVIEIYSAGNRIGTDDYFPNFPNPDYSFLTLIYGPIYL